MAYEVKLMINGKEETFKRTEEPYLIDQTRALILQQHQIKTFGADIISDKALMDNTNDLADFASKFFRGQFTAKDYINGANSKTIKTMNNVLSECLGSDDTDENDKEAKK
ncbi:MULTISPECIES: phage tail assembly chaperone G [Companilactobacillus]|uniref:phage tail assembly chaperone G n=1 Tax=Companilactobacillus TaxID=2767879 RepID=UPI002FF3F1E3